MKMNEEKWKPILGWEGFYSISTHGRVLSHGRERINCTVHGAKILARKRNRGGNPCVTLCDADRMQGMMIARIMAIAFLGLNPESKMVATTIDGNKENLLIENITVCPSWMATDKPPMKIKLTNKAGEVKIYSSQSEASKDTGVRQDSISKYIAKKVKPKSGDLWEEVYA